MFVLRLNLGYTVKYNPVPSGKEVYFTVYLLSLPYTDTLYQKSAILDVLYVDPSFW